MIEEFYFDIGINLNDLNGNLLLLDILAYNLFCLFIMQICIASIFSGFFFLKLTLSETLQFFTTCKILQYVVNVALIEKFLRIE